MNLASQLFFNTVQSEIAVQPEKRSGTLMGNEAINIEYATYEKK